MLNKQTFPNYMQMRHRVPQTIWQLCRFLSVGIGYGLIITSFTRPDMALFIFWRMIIPVLPLLLFVAPGIWRNICPMAALNQTPRMFKFGRGLTPPAWFKNYAYLIGIALFIVLVPTRKEVLNTSGPALGLLLLAVFTAALVGGYFYKGKSGWCATICPLLPLERIYGQTPFVTLPNAYCKPCVGCVKNCYDFNPALANMADQQDSDRRNSQFRRLFAGMLPGLILGFYLIPDPPQVSGLMMYQWIAFFMIVSLGIFLILEVILKRSALRLPTLFGAVAFNYFYLFNLPILAETVQQLFGITLPISMLWAGHLFLFGLSAIWIYRTYRKEGLYQRLTASRNAHMQVSLIQSRSIPVRTSKAG